MKHPHTRIVDQVDQLHGVSVEDPYRWLEELDAPDTRAWITAQNELTQGYLAGAAQRPRIRELVEQLWNHEKYGVPFKRGGRYFYQHNTGLQNQWVLYTLDELHAEGRELLDPNRLSDDGTISLVGLSVSEDGRYLAYGLAEAGSDWQIWKVREIETGRDLPDEVRWVKFSGAAWDTAGEGFYYSRYDEPKKGQAYTAANYYQKVFYHKVGTAQLEDRLVYERPDDKEWGFGSSVTEDGKYLVLTVWRGTHRETNLFYKSLEQEGAEMVELLTGFEASYQLIGNDGALFYCWTDKDAPLGRVVAIDLNRPEPAAWTEVIAQTERTLESASMVGERLIASYLEDAHSRVVVYDTAGRQLDEVSLPGLGSVVGFRGRQEDTETFYMYTSFTVPGAIYRHDLRTGESSLFRRPTIAADLSNFETTQVFYQSKDGTRVPMFLTHKKGLELDGDNPTYLYGYGGFNISLTPAFSVANLVWMELGGVYAQACLRGGGEYGKSWHEGGVKASKQNVFDDFIAAGEWLIANGYTRTPKLAIGGGSNGGLLVGACLTQRPDLFGACVMAVGVLDMLRFHQFTIGWAWVSDFGSPEDPEQFQTLLSYSPYHNLKSGTDYPPTLVCTGDHDDRVFPAHSFKFASRLQACQGGEGPTLIRIDIRAGHGMGKPTAKLIDEVVDRWAFLCRALDW